jgi:hypothetical protein
LPFTFPPPAGQDLSDAKTKKIRDHNFLLIRKRSGSSKKICLAAGKIALSWGRTVEGQKFCCESEVVKDMDARSGNKTFRFIRRRISDVCYQ